ncbi:putative transporter, BCCT family (BetT, Choline-glycine betainetransporter) [Moritella sp. PE36]|uniref:BCCT family transporter n=1 Tax=Moritella sp. PE36 TaxID=58051 RepID=UPI0001568954|nr:BCCT family transporter [Moritella sp. PE36]EDM68477.1 putative transporter, BCCT family (BetT, Choline-glycine betainetransporter) [Moritella sp. PE36]
MDSSLKNNSSLQKNSSLNKYSIETTDYQVGQDNVQKWGFDIHNPVFGISAGLIILFLSALLLVDPATAKETLNSVRNSIMADFDVFFMWSTNFFVFFTMVLIVSPLGKIRIGGKEAKAEHSTMSWMAMLFAAGMGIGLLFWGVAEPTAYFTNWWGTPFNVEPLTAEAKSLALAATIYNWGIHGWAIYGIVALSLAFFAYNKGLPLSIRSVFYPIIGDRAWGWAGHIVDILAVLATLFGLATSLGLGAQQAASGINHVFGYDGGIGLQLLVIAFVTLIAIFSVMRGINGGVKVLSNINMLFAFALLIIVIILGFDVVMVSIPETFVAYAQNFVGLSNPHGRDDTAWMHGWTVFYWAWWISWSPFVGMFIARISKGRTVREFLCAVIFIPTLVTLVWMATFGGIAIDQVANKVGELGANGLTDISLSLFHVYDAMPYGKVLSVLSIILVLIFFITSSDSGSLVIDSITSGGKIDAPVPQRIFWATVEGTIAGVMLWVGGTEVLQALQAGVVTTALPFTFVLLIMCVSLIKGLNSERHLYK